MISLKTPCDVRSWGDHSSWWLGMPGFRDKESDSKICSWLLRCLPHWGAFWGHSSNAACIPFCPEQTARSRWEVLGASYLLGSCTWVEPAAYCFNCSHLSDINSQGWDLVLGGQGRRSVPHGNSRIQALSPVGFLTLRMREKVRWDMLTSPDVLSIYFFVHYRVAHTS